MKFYDFGTAPQAKLDGFDMLVETVVSREETLQTRYGNDDAVYVRGAAVQSRPGMFEFARFENRARREAVKAQHMDYMVRQVPMVIYPDPISHQSIVAPAELPTWRLGHFHRVEYARTFCEKNYLPFTEHDSCPEQVAVPSEGREKERPASC